MSRRSRKPKHRHPAAPTGYPTDADRKHTARVEAIKARRKAESDERWRITQSSRAVLTSEARALAEGRPPPRRVPSVLLLAAAMGMSTGVRR